MKKFIKEHPLIFVIIIAVLVRVPAVIWSTGYIHSDDHFQTVHIANDWAHGGLWGTDGHLRWDNRSSDQITRFPPYTLFLYSIIKLYHSVGYTSLNTIMYGIRAVHSAISLLPVIAAFLIARFVTGKNSWAVISGIAIAINFSFPFLGVRNLLEVVGGNIWAISILLLYRYQWHEKNKWDLYFAGIIAGLAWMIRFQIVFAVFPIPFILWYIYKNIRPAIQYSIGVAIMLVIAGFVDYFLMGIFASSTIALLSNLTNSPMYNTIPLMYPLELLLFLFPPVSFLAYYLIFRPSFYKKHLLLFLSSFSFIFFHMILKNQQERFIFPVIPVIIILFILAIWDKYTRDGYIIRPQKVFRWLVISSVIINLALLAFLTHSPGHYGLVKTMTWIENNNSSKPIMIVKPDLKKFIPFGYAGIKSSQITLINTWDELNSLKNQSKDWGYYILYPNKEIDLDSYLDSVTSLYGPVKLDKTIEPSAYDNLLHNLNPKHNPSYKTCIYKSVNQ